VHQFYLTPTHRSSISDGGSDRMDVPLFGAHGRATTPIPGSHLSTPGRELRSVIICSPRKKKAVRTRDSAEPQRPGSESEHIFSPQFPYHTFVSSLMELDSRCKEASGSDFVRPFHLHLLSFHSTQKGVSRAREVSWSLTSTIFWWGGSMTILRTRLR
jgi:hypothetical protein